VGVYDSCDQVQLALEEDRKHGYLSRKGAALLRIIQHVNRRAATSASRSTLESESIESSMRELGRWVGGCLQAKNRILTSRRTVSIPGSPMSEHDLEAPCTECVADIHVYSVVVCGIVVGYTGRQDDAPTFLMQLLNTLYADGIRKGRLHELLMIGMAATIENVQGHGEGLGAQESDESKYVLPVYTSSRASLGRCITETMQPMELTEERNTCGGPRTRSTVVGYRREVINRFPESLLLHLIPSTAMHGIHESPITLEEALSLSSNQRDEGDTAEYELEAIVIHSGTARSGHYWSYVKAHRQWYYCNDATVRRETWLDISQRVSHMTSGSPLLLRFTKRSQGPTRKAPTISSEPRSAGGRHSDIATGVKDASTVLLEQRYQQPRGPSTLDVSPREPVRVPASPTSSHTEPGLGRMGIRTFGNNCYMNAVLQLLRYVSLLFMAFS
jgi:hypothetical protein